jgi:hypothetical protein
VVDGVVVGVVGFLEGDLAGEAAGSDAALGASQDRPEPAATASSVGAHVQVAADPDEPDGGGGAQGSVGPQGGDLQLVGRPDLVELLGSPVAHCVSPTQGFLLWWSSPSTTNL